MTEKELNKLFHLRKDISRLDNRLKRLDKEDCLSAVNYSGMPHGSGGMSSPIENLIQRKEELRSLLISLKEKETLEELKITSYIESVEDEDIKSIMKLRFIECMKWEKIADELYMERTTPHKKLLRFLESQ